MPEVKKVLPSVESAYPWIFGDLRLAYSQRRKVTVLSPPPPERFHPSGLTNYQAIENLIIQGEIGQYAVRKLIPVHLTVTESEEFFYEIWPEDEYSAWIQNFGLRNRKTKWREVGRSRDKLRLKTLVARPKQHPLPEPVECVGKTGAQQDNSTSQSLSTGPHHITQCGPSQTASIVALSMLFFFLSRFALLVSMVLTCALIDKAFAEMKSTKVVGYRRIPKEDDIKPLPQNYMPSFFN